VADVFLAARAEMPYLPEVRTEAEIRGYVRDRLLRELEVSVAAE